MKLCTMALLSLVAPFAAGCSASTDYYFDGRVYDGQTGSALTSYKIQLQYLDRKDGGHVDEQGRYFLGPLTPFNDYDIAITAGGYRPFLSQNTMKLDDEQTMNDNAHDDKQHPDRSQSFDAYLYPTSLTTSPATLRVTLSGSADAPSGTVTFRAIGSQSPFAAADTSSQVWKNDDDLRAAAVTEPFTKGSIALAAGQLVYGVTYAVTLEVAGYPRLVTTYTAGVQADTTFVVSPTESPLALVYVTTSGGLPTRGAALVLGFDRSLVVTSAVRSDVTARAAGHTLSLSRPLVDAGEGPVTLAELGDVTVRAADSEMDVLLTSLAGVVPITVAATP